MTESNPKMKVMEGTLTGRRCPILRLMDVDLMFVLVTGNHIQAGAIISRGSAISLFVRRGSSIFRAKQQVEIRPPNSILMSVIHLLK